MTVLVLAGSGAKSDSRTGGGGAGRAGFADGRWGGGAAARAAGPAGGAGGPAGGGAGGGAGGRAGGGAGGGAGAAAGALGYGALVPMGGLDGAPDGGVDGAGDDAAGGAAGDAVGRLVDGTPGSDRGRDGAQEDAAGSSPAPDGDGPGRSPRLARPGGVVAPSRAERAPWPSGSRSLRWSRQCPRVRCGVERPAHDRGRGGAVRAQPERTAGTDGTDVESAGADGRTEPAMGAGAAAAATESAGTVADRGCRRSEGTGRPGRAGTDRVRWDSGGTPGQETTGDAASAVESVDRVAPTKSVPCPHLVGSARRRVREPGARREIASSPRMPTPTGGPPHRVETAGSAETPTTSSLRAWHRLVR